MSGCPLPTVAETCMIRMYRTESLVPCVVRSASVYVYVCDVAVTVPAMGVPAMALALLVKN